MSRQRNLSCPGRHLVSKLGNGLLSAVAVALTLLSIEGTLRVLACVLNRQTIEEALRSLDPVTSGQPAALRQVVRLSRDPRIIYELRPTLSVLLKGKPVTINDQGFRSRRRTVRQGDPDTFRIVGIGDSYMFGLGVGDGECYLDRLASMLEAASPGRSFDLLNTAVPGYNTVLEVETLKVKGLSPEPDLVIIELIGNDLELPNFIRKQEPALSLNRCFLCDFLRRRLYRERRARAWIRQHDAGLVRAPRDPMTGRFLQEPDQVPREYAALVGWQAYESAMSRLADMSDRHGFEVLVLSPAIWESSLQRRARQLSSRLGFHWLDVGAVLRRFLRSHGMSKLGGSPLALGENDYHPSVLCHQIIAETILGYLEKSLLRNDSQPGSDTGGGAAATGGSDREISGRSAGRHPRRRSAVAEGPSGLF